MPWGQKRAVAPAALDFLKNQLLEKMKLQEVTWAELGPTWAPKRAQNGAQGGGQDGAKKEKKK